MVQSILARAEAAIQEDDKNVSALLQKIRTHEKIQRRWGESR